MDDTNNLDSDYEVIEQCLQQTQNDLTKVLSSLTDLSKCGTHDNNDNNISDNFSGWASSVGTFPRRRQSRTTQNVDFLAIFAQHDLLADRRSLDLLRRAAPGSETWNYTLPNLRKRPSRPTTLVPSVWSSHSGFSRPRNKDWRAYVNGSVDYVLPHRDTKGFVGNSTVHLGNRAGQWPSLHDRRNNNFIGGQRRVMTSHSFNSPSTTSTAASGEILRAKRMTNCVVANNHRSNSQQDAADVETIYAAETKVTRDVKMANTTSSSLDLPNGHAAGAATNGWTPAKPVSVYECKSLSSTSSSELSSPISDLGKPVLCIPPPPPPDHEGNFQNGHVLVDGPSRSCRDQGPSVQSQSVIIRSERADVSKGVPTAEDAASVRLRYVEAALRSQPQRPKNHIIDDAIPRMQAVNEKHMKHSPDCHRTSTLKARNNSSVLLQQRSRSVSPEERGPRRATNDKGGSSSDDTGFVGFTELDPDVVEKELHETELLIEKTNVIAACLDCCDDDSVALLRSIRRHECDTGHGDKCMISSNVKLNFADVRDIVSCEEVHDMLNCKNESGNDVAPAENKMAKSVVKDETAAVDCSQGNTVKDTKTEKSAILVIVSEMPQTDDAEWVECTEIIATRNIETTTAVVAKESVVSTEMKVADCSVQCDLREEVSADLEGDAEVTFRPSTPREQRRCTRSARPKMPVIVEDVMRMGDPEDDITESSSAASSLRKHVSSGDDKTGSENSLEGRAKNDGESNSESSPQSLLDMLHKKYYPSQYKGRDRVKSAESLCSKDSSSPDMTSHYCSTKGGCHASGAHSAENIVNAVTPSGERKVNQHVSPVEPLVLMLPAPLVGLCDKNAGKQMAPQQPLTLPRARSMSPRLPSMSPRLPFLSRRERSMSPKEGQASPDMRRCHLCQESQHSSNSPGNFEEIEALEACTWLRAAGFPQYAQMYEDKLFPIDISCVEKDHDFLDSDSICSLFRRLNTLNKCATMKIEAPPRKMVDDSDDEDQCALSDKWRYQRSSRRWSRKDLDLVPQLNGDETAPVEKLRSSSSHDSMLTDNEESTSQTGDSPVFAMRSPHIPRAPTPTDVNPQRSTSAPIEETNSPVTTPSGIAPSPRLQRAASDRFRGAKNFLKRMENFSTRRSTRRHKGTISRLDIGSPVLVDTPEVKERMDQLGCVNISPTLPTPPPSSSAALSSPGSGDSVFENSPVVGRKKFADTYSSGSVHNSEVSLSGSQTATPSTLRRCHSGATSKVEVYSLQPGYKPGGFPKLVSNGYIEMNNGSQLNYRTGSFNLGMDRHCESVVLRHSKTPTPEDEDVPVFNSEHRQSIYDNVPAGSPGDAQQELDMILCDLFKNISGLNQSLQQYSADASELSCRRVTDTTGALTMKIIEESKDINILAMAEDLDDDTEISQCVDDTDDTVELCSPQGKQNDADSRSASPLSSSHDMSDSDSPESREDEGSDQPEKRERRDSGVGSSLTRAPSDRRRHRIRWHSFMKQHRPSFNSQNMQISSMSVGQMMLLHKLCLLKITALMEKYSPSNRSGWNWAMPKFIKRLKAPDYKDKNVFGVPLLVILQRTGQPLPQCILYAMRCLRRTAKDAVGIFRKSGVRSRIQKLRNEVEEHPDGVDFESLHAYDVADLLKQYFRELPECLLTNKLSETFISIYTHVPKEYHLEALQAVVMLLPDENRNVLQSLLLFLSDMARFSDHNQMTASNLAVCFAPSLFHMCGPRNNPNVSPRRGRKQIGIPDQRELLDQKAAHECLTQMVIECKKIFAIPDDMLGRCRFSYIEQGDPVPLEELGCKRLDNETVDHTAYIESCIQGVLKEAHDKFKGWVTVSSPTHLEFAYKKVGDGHPLRLWKCATEVEAPPVEVLNRILRERHLWDEDLAKWRVVEKLDAHTDVFQYVINSMVPHPSRDFCELRSYRTQLAKGACILVSTSVQHKDAPLMGGVRAVVLASRFLIEPCGSGKSRLTHICRVDTRGHSPEWYNKCYGHLVANDLARIRDSFKQPIETTDGPETKI